MSVKRKAYEWTNRGLLAGPKFLAPTARNLLAAFPWGRFPPRFIMVEPTNGCNLRCPLCPVGAQTTTRDPGFLDVDAYRVLLDEIKSHVRRILMNFAGEPLLHPKIGELISATRQAGIRIDVGTHGNLDRMEEIVEAGVDSVLFDIDGATQEVYEIYRRRGRVDRAIANLHKLVAARDRKGDGGPIVILQMVIMKHNIHEVAEVVRIGAEAGVDCVSLRSVCINDFFDRDDMEEAKRWIPPEPLEIALGIHRAGWRGRRPPLCDWFTQCVILHNGDMSICCYDTDGKHVVGNVFTDGFSRVWRGRRMGEARKGVVHQSHDVCRHCDLNLLEPVVFDPRNPPPTLAALRSGAADSTRSEVFC